MAISRPPMPSLRRRQTKKLIYILSIHFKKASRSDGYWVLSDAVEKPNLMQHAAKQIKQIFKSKKSWKIINYFLLIYGLISYSFILFFVYFVVIKNPNSILYFPQNLLRFVQNLFASNSQFSLAELGQLFIPMLFFYLVFGLLKSLLMKKKLLSTHPKI